MTSANCGPRAKPERASDQGDGAHPGWQELRTRIGGIVDELGRNERAEPLDDFEQVNLISLGVGRAHAGVGETRLT